MAQPELPRKRGVPPLVWIVLAILVAWIAIWAFRHDWTHRTPHGGAVPASADGVNARPAPVDREAMRSKPPQQPYASRDSATASSSRP
jgi:hypothetical protein